MWYKRKSRGNSNTNSKSVSKLFIFLRASVCVRAPRWFCFGYANTPYKIFNENPHTCACNAVMKYKNAALSNWSSHCAHSPSSRPHILSNKHTRIWLFNNAPLNILFNNSLLIVPKLNTTLIAYVQPHIIILISRKYLRHARTHTHSLHTHTHTCEADFNGTQRWHEIVASNLVN